MIKALLSLLTLILLSSCSLAPFASNKSGKSYGAGNSRFELGSANSGYYIKLGFGASENLDIGYVMEFGGFPTSGIFLKYSLANNDTGASHATEFGYGGTETSTYYYAGFISSIAFTKDFELFVNPRLVKVQTDEKDVELGDTVGNVIVTEYDLSYVYLSAGMNLWLTETFGLSIYSIYVNGHGLETEENLSTATTAIFRF